MIRVIGCLVIMASFCASSASTGASGDWPAPRHDSRLTARQPCPGTLRAAPAVLTRTPVAAGRAHLVPFASAPGAVVDRALAVTDGALRCWDLAGKLLWVSHPPGLNFESINAIEDLDGDGRVEIAAAAGRPGSPFGAALLVDAASGELLWRYDVEPMSYSWFYNIGHFLPQGVGKQLVVLEHGYPPDKLNGYMVLFEFPAPGKPPVARWRYDFDQYTCFPSLLQSDVDGDGIQELCVETHSRMWVLDALSGAVKQFVQWDVAPANVRSYGLVKFQDLNGDGREDFLCIANFAQHHEVLLNEDGKLRLAWVYGWDNSVTTSKIATTWAEPPVADVDGDGRLEVVLSMFNVARSQATATAAFRPSRLAADGDARWAIRVYDAVTGEIKARVADRIAARVADVDGDGAGEILADICRDPTRAVVPGAVLIKLTGGQPREMWRRRGARAEVARSQATATAAAGLAAGGGRGKGDHLLVSHDGQTYALSPASGKFILTPYARPPKAKPDLSAIDAAAGQMAPPPLVSDLDADGKPEIIHTWQGKVTIYHWDRAAGLKLVREYSADGAPAIADVDGDGRAELIIGQAAPSHEPVVRVLRADGSTLWESRLPPTERRGLPHGRAVYLQVGRFTGKATPDIYALFGTPVVRSVVLDGASGKPVWEKSEFPAIERYWGPTINLAAVYDVDGDGAEDLVFTNPDYYCVASGKTGDLLVGPAFPPKIFDQPSQGLYTLPAILEHPGAPLVVLCDGHYFLGEIGLRAEPRWYQLPELGAARTGAEGFMRLPDGEWLIGFGRQDGDFACLDAATGQVRWELPLAAAAGDVVACDIDGDGADEFVFGDSHGYLWAVRDGEGKPVVTWKTRVGAGVGSPVIADLDGDGALQIVAPTADGNLTVLGVPGH